MKRGERKRALAKATAVRCALEQERQDASVLKGRRLDEDDALKMFKSLPSIEELARA